LGCQIPPELQCDEARLRQVWQSFEAIIDDIKARSAKPIQTRPDPAQIEHKRLTNERKRLFGGNGRQR
jgi:hypothetical protein